MTETVKPFLVPDLGEGLEEATVSCWNVAVGDDVELNQTLCSLETAKAEVEIPSPYAGRIVELRGAEGDVLEVGSLLVRIDTGTAPAAVARNGAPPGGVVGNGAPPGRTPVLVGYGSDAGLDTSRRPKAKPPVRKLAAELLVDLDALAPGSGANGIITREDVLAAADHPESGPGRTDDLRPVRGVQAQMAQRMSLSRSQIPDAHAGVQVDCTSLLRLRDRFCSAPAEGGAPITPFVLTLRLIVVALTHHQVFNSSWLDTPEGPRVQIHPAIHLGFGVAAPRGLLVPVVADAQDKTTLELAGSVARLIRDARDGTLKPAELQGSTFTVSNFGALGLDYGVPVINYPEAAILGMGSLKPRPVVVDDDIVIRPTMTLTCAFDHRVADGAQVAQFLGEVRELIESPEMALLHL